MLAVDESHVAVCFNTEEEPHGARPLGMKLLCCLLLTACTSAAESTGISEVSCPTDSTLTYDNFGSAFFTDNCLSCHASRERPTLSTQAQILANKSSILQEAVYTTAMPEDASMDLSERELLGEWLACGAP